MGMLDWNIKMSSPVRYAYDDEDLNLLAHHFCPVNPISPQKLTGFTPFERHGKCGVQAP